MIVNSKQFKAAMDLVEPARESRATIPILSAVRATWTAKGFRLDANNLDANFRATLPAQGSPIGSTDEFTIVDPRAVLSAVNAAGGVEVTFDHIRASKAKDQPEALKIKAGRLVLTQKPLPAEDFPENQCDVGHVLFETEISAAVLNDVARVFPAISTEETRYYLNGVHVSKLEGSEWTYRFAATDGHRLFVMDIALPSAAGQLPSNVIVPRRFIQAVTKNFVKSKDAISFRLGNGRGSNGQPMTTTEGDGRGSRCSFGGKVGEIEVAFDGKLIDGTYPDYSRVIPKEGPRHATFNATALRQAVLAVSAASSASNLKAIKIEFEAGRAVISKAMGGDGNEARMDLDAGHNCDRMTAGFNGTYLLEALNSFRGDEIVLSFEEPTQAARGPGFFEPISCPTLVRDPADTAFFVVLMPMRV